MIVKRGKGDFHQAYRPCRISEVVGNDEVKRVIENAFKENKVPHAFLFYGLSGTGKTTIARIIEMGLNCAEGLTSEPCCECDHCNRIINRYGSLAIREINAVEVDKEWLKGALRDFHGYPSGLFAGLKRNIFLVDECHGLTTDQASLFLKYVEDVSEDNYYFFCTTEAHKFLDTLKSRCTIKVKFKEVPDNEILKLLSEICEQEKLQPDEKVLKDIIEKSKGMPRNAVNQLQQSYHAGKLKKKIIQTLTGNNNLLVIAPHGHPKDDFNTGKIARRMHDKFGCYAVINEEYQKPESAGLDKPDISKGIADLYDWNHLNEFPELKEGFLDPIEDFKSKILAEYQMLYIIHTHGIDDENIPRVAEITEKQKNEPDNLHVLVGYGQRADDNSKHTANLEKFVQPFIKKIEGDDLKIDIAPAEAIIGTDGKEKLYCGNHPDKLNQRLCDPKDKVQSIQLEIKKKNARENQDQAFKTADCLCTALSKTVSDTLLVPAKIKNEDDLVSEAFDHLKGIFKRHFHEAMLEAGKYLIDTFYEKNPKIAFAKNKTKEEPQSLKKLIEKIQQTSNNPSENVPSTGWVYNAVNLAAHEMICKQEGFQTFGILGHSHKLQLLHVPKLKKIDKDKFNEAIMPAFQEKERLASVAIEKKLSVRGFKAYIKEQYPNDSGTIDLTKLPPLDELRQLESKELVRLWNLSKRKIDENQKMIGICAKAIDQLGIVLAEINTSLEPGKGGYQDWTKSKNNVNICTGCKNDCVYCYMKPINARNPKLKQPENWHNWELRQDDVDKNYGLRDGLVGFPSSHDIFPEILDASLTVLGKILRAGNDVLIVSKPRMECIKAICAASLFFKNKILFRFTIGAMSDETLSYWEPNSPKYDERKECLEYAFHNGFRTSVSMEPMLDSPNIEALVKDLLPFVSEDIWLGTMNHLGWIKKGADERLLSELEIIEAGQTPERLLEVYKIYENNPKIKWKTDALKIIGKGKERQKNGERNPILGELYAKFRSEKSYFGYNPSVLKSGIQKYARRGEVEKGLWCLVEMDMFSLLEWDSTEIDAYLQKYPEESRANTQNSAQRIRTNMVNRLVVIMSEEVNVCAWWMSLKIFELYQKWTENRGNPSSRKYLLEMYLYLMSQQKIRLISDFKSVYLIPPDYLKPTQMDNLRQMHNKIQEQYPKIYSGQAEVGEVDWEVDMGKYPTKLKPCVNGIIYNLEKGCDHVFYWIRELCDLELKDKLPLKENKKKNESFQYNYLGIVWDVLYGFIDRNREYECARETILALQEFYKRMTHREKPIYLYHALLLLVRFKEIDWNSEAPTVDTPFDEVEKLYEDHLRGGKIQMDDYVLDLHTKKGKLSANSLENFALEGAYIKNQNDKFLNQEYREIYNSLKKELDIYKSKDKKIQHDPSDIEMIALKVGIPIQQLSGEDMAKLEDAPQAQRKTAHFKKAVYIVEDLVFKGPYPCDDEKLINSLKYPYAIELLEEALQLNEWQRGSLRWKYLGCTEDNQYYLVASNVGSRENIPFERVTTKIEKNVKVALEGSLISTVEDIESNGQLTGEIKSATLQHLYLRFLLDIGDSGTHNVLVRKDNKSAERLIAGVDLEDRRGIKEKESRLAHLFKEKTLYKKHISLYGSDICKIKSLSYSQLDQNTLDSLNAVKIDLERLKENIELWDKLN
jgi:DNA polymerase III subunit gamma/tau